MIRKIYLASLLFLLLLAGCSGKSDQTNVTIHEEETGNEQVIEIRATNWQFDQEEYRIRKGQPVKVTLINEEGRHGAGIKGLSILLNDNESVIFTVHESGEYELFCNIPCGHGHSQMISKFIVED